MSSSQEVVQSERMMVEIEELRREMPIDLFLQESSDLKEIMQKLEKEYEKRERVIDRIMDQGTGFESRNALRMFSTSLLEKWAERLESSRRKE